jgi:hypothetical protein
MATTLVNVRLDPVRRRKARILRARGVTLSDVVREAIDERFAALERSTSPPDARALIASLYEQYPDPPDLLPRDYDVHDRATARRAVARRLRRGRP